MKSIFLNLVAREPLVLTDGSSEGMSHKTLEHIPGNMLLGAYAAYWKNRHPGVCADSDPEFAALFLEGGVEWGHAYPCVDGEACVPIPVSYQRDKLRDSLPVEGQPGTNCGVYNLYALTEQNKPTEVKKYKKLPAGFMSPTTMYRPALRTGWSMHVAMSARRTAADRQLFGYSSVAPGPMFQSTLLCHDDSVGTSLEKLLQGCGHIHVGHSRSAGYGRVECHAGEGSMARTAVSGQEATLFFLSDYVPVHTWQSPLESLEQELCDTLGVTVTIDLDPRKMFCAYAEIAAFNGLWGLPRRTVTAIQRGSLLRVTWQGTAGALPASIGGRRNEGYGRILVDPDFLKSLKIRPAASEAGKTVEVPSVAMSPTLTVVRRRSIDRLALEAATAFVASDRVGKFLDSAGRNARPTPSQLGNIRNHVTMGDASETWLAKFREMLGKTPGEQWKEGIAWCPVEDYLDHLSDIMPRLFSVANCLKLVGGKARLELVGGEATTAEQQSFERRFHRLAILELLGAWEKSKRRADNEQRRGN